ncbi:MAG: protein kinase, partial [Polyangiales bacterium]
LLAKRDGLPLVVKIADFGIARLDARFVTGDDETVSAHDPTVSNPMLTQTGVILGTPAYMAPELARGTRDARPSADVFAFGVIAYELLTGGYPFAQIPLYGNTGDSLRRSPLPPTLPVWCAKLVDGCLAEDPATRPTATEIEQALVDAGASLDAAS